MAAFGTAGLDWLTWVQLCGGAFHSIFRVVLAEATLEAKLKARGYDVTKLLKVAQP